MTHQPEPAAKSRRLPIILAGAASLLVLVVVGVIALTVGGSDTRAGGIPVKPAGTKFTLPPSVSAPATTSATQELSGSVVGLACYGDGDLESRLGFEVTDYDFSEAWAAKATSCEVYTVNGVESADTQVIPQGPVEEAAYKASGYDDNDIATLFTLCGDVDPEDAYAEAGFSMSPSQVKEITGALELCPKHPFAGKWKAAMKRGEGDAKLEAEGRVFYDGTYRVGKDIKPGTYVVKDVDGCYWERQDRNGEIIDNNFINSAKRVQVTIRKSDYGFHAKGCGEWRPA